MIGKRSEYLPVKVKHFGRSTFVALIVLSSGTGEDLQRMFHDMYSESFVTGLKVNYVEIEWNVKQTRRINVSSMSWGPPGRRLLRSYH